MPIQIVTAKQEKVLLWATSTSQPISADIVGELAELDVKVIQHLVWEIRKTFPIRHTHISSDHPVSDNRPAETLISKVEFYHCSREDVQAAVSHMRNMKHLLQNKGEHVLLGLLNLAFTALMGKSIYDVVAPGDSREPSES